MNKVKATALALLAVLALFVPVAFSGYASASSTVATAAGSAPGDEVYVVSGSNGKVVAKDNVYGSKNIWRYEGTYVTYLWKDVDYFWVPGGCDAINVNTGYKYVGDRTYGPMNGSYYLLQLRVVC